MKHGHKLLEVCDHVTISSQECSLTNILNQTIHLVETKILLSVGV